MSPDRLQALAIELLEEPDPLRALALGSIGTDGMRMVVWGGTHDSSRLARYGAELATAWPMQVFSDMTPLAIQELLLDLRCIVDAGELPAAALVGDGAPLEELGWATRARQSLRATWLGRAVVDASAHLALVDDPVSHAVYDLDLLELVTDAAIDPEDDDARATEMRPTGKAPT